MNFNFSSSIPLCASNTQSRQCVDTHTKTGIKDFNAWVSTRGTLECDSALTIKLTTESNFQTFWPRILGRRSYTRS